MATLFGFEITRSNDKKKDQLNQQEPTQKTFTVPQSDDGAVTIQTGSYYGVYVDLDGVVRNEIELVTRYREMGLQPELETAIDEIVNEAIVMDDKGQSVELNLDDLEQPESIKKKITDEFENVLRLLNFGNMGHDIFRRWYIDGRLFYHIVIDEANQSKGIIELRYIDPRRIRKIREIQKGKDPKSGMELIKSQKEYYLYNERGVVGAHSNLGTRIAVDSIVNVNSGLMDAKRAMVLSYLHKAIKPLNQLRMVEDATVIYRLSRAPERRIFYVDVGNMPTIKAEQYLRDIMVKYRNKLVYDSCLAMDTKIPLLDGRTLTITELQKEFEEGKENWVYSCDPITGKFAPGLITSAGVTRFNEKVMKITLDNGKTITCTYDHKFPVWNKGKVEAKDLVVGDSMIPFYTRYEKVATKSNEYHQIFANERNKWVFTHREVSAWKDNNNLLNEMVFNPLYENESKKTVHHKNYNRFDNTPGNLARMYNLDHLEYHKQHNSLAGKIGGKRTAEKRKELGLPYFPKRPSKETLIESGKRLSSLKLGFMAWTPEEKREHNIECNRIVVERLANDPVFNAAFRKALSDGWSQESRKEAAIRGKEKYNDKNGIGKKESCNVCGITTTIGNIARWHNQKCKKLRNHKITSIEYLDEPMDVGTLGIDKNEIYHDYHTFALDAGIYTCNSTGEIKDDRKHLSMLEDFFLPRREGSRGTEITTLPGGQNLGEMADVEYFEKKLYKALGVPVSRLEQNNGFSLGRTTEITRDELKFAKFVQRLRNKFSTLFDDLLRVQLVLKRICTAEEWVEFREKIWYDFKKDNNFNELKEAELLTNRIMILQSVDPFVGKYYSLEWVRKNVLQLTDEDIEEIDEQIANEADQMAAQQQAQADQMAAQGLSPDGAPLQQQQQAPGDQQMVPQEEEPAPSNAKKFVTKSNELEMI